MSIASLKSLQNCEWPVLEITPSFLEKDNFWFEQVKRCPEFKEKVLIIKPGLRIPLYELLRKLDELGYERVERVEEMGEFAVRGNILELFPIHTQSALRLEFFGNTIEQIEILKDLKKDIKNEHQRLLKKIKNQKDFSDLQNLKPGDYVVHLDHGVGRFLGIVSFRLSQDLEIMPTKETRYYVLEYAKGDKLYVPLGLERKLSRYIAFSEPKISRLGSPLWHRTKRKVKAEAEKLAKELLSLYAKRAVIKRPPYSIVQDEIEKEVQSTFPFEETKDQLRAWQDIEKDLKEDIPMDRIICGDVGFGKTELALRAMVRAVICGKQAVLLCPTTLLASQHFETIKTRLINTPIRVVHLSRLQPIKEQKRVIKEIAEGKADIIVGTHRLLSKDVVFKNLGMLVIDEEQRFGVRHKEKLKSLRLSLDILSLSATPIPRTLYLALSSLRDISFVKTPPYGRKPIKTIVARWSKEIIKKAIEFELSRKGQVYYLHNRIESLAQVKRMLEKLAGEQAQNWKIGVLHGRLPEKDMVKIMTAFRKGELNILLATSIIENGLDLSNVNTLIVDDSSRLGLSQAHQMRGRIGRGFLQAFAYFLYSKRFTQNTKIRIEALKKMSYLGAGFEIAKKDLEMRGAGNILGKEQAGSVNAVGLNLYCQILAEAIEKLKRSSKDKFEPLGTLSEINF